MAIMSINFIKLIALVCMLIDHIGEFIPQSPVWFRYIGRLAAPLFFYCSAWGFYHTRSREKYMLRLYIFGILMSLGNIYIYHFVCNGSINSGFSNDIFVTIFLGCTIVYLYEKADSRRKRIKYMSLLFLQQIAAFILCVVFAELLNIPKTVGTYMLYYGYGSLFGSMVFTEGSILFVLFFAAVYSLKDKPFRLSVFVCVFSAFLTLLIRRTYYMRGPASYLIPFDRYQWMMIMAIPFFFLYNGKRGRNFKWFFYLFYPLHIWILCILGT